MAIITAPVKDTERATVDHSATFKNLSKGFYMTGGKQIDIL